MNETRIRIAVAAIDLFEAVSAIVGAIGLVVGFMNIPVAVLSGTPFADFTIPALLLGVVVGGSALVAAVVSALGHRYYDAVASGIAGGITVGFLTVEIAMIGLGAWPQVVWMLVGLAMVGLGALLWQVETRSAALSRTQQPI
jgi:hypothetical protein